MKLVNLLDIIKKNKIIFKEGYSKAVLIIIISTWLIFSILLYILSIKIFKYFLKKRGIKFWKNNIVIPKNLTLGRLSLKDNKLFENELFINEKKNSMKTLLEIHEKFKKNKLISDLKEKYILETENNFEYKYIENIEENIKNKLFKNLKINFN